jgi:hypothetical protein
MPNANRRDFLKLAASVVSIDSRTKELACSGNHFAFP